MVLTLDLEYQALAPSAVKVKSRLQQYDTRGYIVVSSRQSESPKHPVTFFFRGA